MVDGEYLKMSGANRPFVVKNSFGTVKFTSSLPGVAPICLDVPHCQQQKKIRSIYMNVNHSHAMCMDTW